MVPPVSLLPEDESVNLDLTSVGCPPGQGDVQVSRWRGVVLFFRLYQEFRISYCVVLNFLPKVETAIRLFVGGYLLFYFHCLLWLKYKLVMT